MLSNHVKNEILKDYFIAVNGTKDCSRNNQLSVCTRIVVKHLLHSEIFVGLYEIDSSSADSIEKMLLDVMARFDLSLNYLRGQKYDGAANMTR